MKINKISLLIISFLLLTPVFLLALPLQPLHASTARSIVFPVIGPATFSNDYYVPRPKGIHGATDIMAAKGQKLIAAVDGEITYVAYPQAPFGYDVEITDEEGYTYIYLHINDDTPGTNDGNGGGMNAYAPDMKIGNRVEKGQHIGYLGDSGYSNGVPHLHFEIIAPDGSTLNPYYSLINAPRAPTPSLYPPLKAEKLPYWVKFEGGLNLAMGDFNGDQNSETVTGAGTGGGPHVKTYSSANEFLGEFFAYDPDFKGGIDVATGDMDGDGVDEIITGPGPGGGPWVRVFNTQAKLLSEFAAYDPAFRGGIDVAAADTDSSPADEIITGPGPGGGPWVRVFNAQAESVVDIQVYDIGFKGGVKVSAGDVKSNSPKNEIMSIPWAYGEPRVRLMTNTGENIVDYNYIESWWIGHYDVAAGNDESRLGTGINRRASMRNGPSGLEDPTSPSD